MKSYWEVSERWFEIREVEMDYDPTSMRGDSTFYKTFREAKAALCASLEAQKAEIEEKLATLRKLKKNDTEKFIMEQS